ncbi:MAG TPA: DUF4188 domain-containing protein [Burkholderiaceae bacterium]|jgi:hypothetical protein|nr:DUF4188 domain-containing protein [Burkholderiaceae bacterium]
MNKARCERLTATIDGDFAVFLIGMRINSVIQVRKWLPVAMAMPRMLKELRQRPELGLLHYEMWGGRTTLMVQYWRSVEQLLAYATNRQAEHLPAWQAFNRAVGMTGAVGIWHETYSVAAGRHESVYVNMPAFGLGKAAGLQPASGARHSAAGRLRLPQHQR